MLKHLRARTEGKSLLQKGFTLVELLVVIVILGILAAVVVFAIGGTQGKAKESACKAEQATVETAYEAYKAQRDAAPQTWQNLIDNGNLKREPTTIKGFDWDTGTADC